MVPRVIVLIIVLICINALIIAQQAELNSRQYNIEINAANNHEALLQLSAQIGYNFSYNSNLVDTSSARIKLRLRKSTIDNALDQILNDTSISYQVLEQQIILVRKFEIKAFNNDSCGVPSRISGVILDGQTDESIEYATVAIKSKKYGTIANINGRFNLALDSCNKKDTLSISALGYTTFNLPFTSIVKETNIIYLQPRFIPIQQVIIRRVNPEVVVGKAILASDNYSKQGEFSYKAFYREYVLKEHETKSVYEALLEGFSKGHENIGTRVKIIKALKIKENRNNDTLVLKLQGGISTITLHDIQEKKPEFFNMETKHAYQYHLDDIIQKGNNDVYVIAFKNKPEFDVPPYKGTLYVDIKTLHLIGAEVEIKNKNAFSNTKIFVYKKNRNVKAKVRSFKYRVGYSQNNISTHLQHIRTELRIDIRKKNEVFSSDYTVVSECLVTDFNTDNPQSLTRSETTKDAVIFSDEIKKYPIEFWEEYNILVPDDIVNRP